MKPIIKSRTTRNVLLGTGVGGFSIIGLIAFLRTQWPDLLPWTADGDAFIVTTLNTIVAAILSRFASWAIDRDKLPRA